MKTQLKKVSLVELFGGWNRFAVPGRIGIATAQGLFGIDRLETSLEPLEASPGLFCAAFDAALQATSEGVEVLLMAFEPTDRRMEGAG